MSGTTRLLLVDDDREQSALLLKYMAHSRPEFSFSVAVDGEECLAMLAEDGYSAVVLDYLLPGMVGTDVLKEMRARGHDLPVVIVTGQGDEYVAVEAMKAGACDYVVKDERYFSNLPHTIDRALELNRLMVASRKLQDDIVEHNKALVRLSMMTREINSCLRSSSLPPIVVEGAARLLGADAAALLLFKDDSQEVEYAAFHGFDGVPDPVRVFEDGGLRELVLSAAGSGGPVRFGRRELDGFAGPVTLVSAPLSCGSKMSGCLVALSAGGSDGFSDPDLEILGLVAGHAAVALDNARLFEKASEAGRLKDQLYQSEKLASVGQLVSGVAHELNNPLTAVMGYTQMLMMTDTDKRRLEDLRRVNESAQRCKKIVNNLLSYARRHKPETTLSNMNDTIRETVALRAYDLKVNNIELRDELSESLPDIKMDVHQMQQVILNLLINAEQAVQSTGEAKGRITVSTSITEREGVRLARVVVEDDGPGVPDSELSRIFEPFYTTKEPGKGTGLGLPICRGIVSEHGGELWAENIEGRGARFVVEIPVDSSRSLKKPRRVSEPRPSFGAGAGRRVLLVDDEPQLVDIMADALVEDGYEVDVASCGDEALAKVEGGEYDLVVSDIKMPDGDGRQLYWRLRDVRPEMASRVLFITGDTSSADTMKFLREVGGRFLTKPFSLDDFKKACGRAAPAA